MEGDFVYLIIFEDGTIKYTYDFSEDLCQSADDGYVDIVDITDPEMPLQYLPGKGFIPIEECQ